MKHSRVQCAGQIFFKTFNQLFSILTQVEKNYAKAEA